MDGKTGAAEKPLPPVQCAPDATSPDPRFRQGTLQYTKHSLRKLFGWLLWGDLCFKLMETVLQNVVIPLRLKDLNVSNEFMALITKSIPSGINIVLNPVLSTFSDHYRSRLGRRLPFLLLATPFVVGLLVLLAFSGEIGSWAHHLFGSSNGWTISATTVGVMTVLIVLLSFFDLTTNILFFLLFNDVVPRAFLGRFFSLFRMVGLGVGAFFSFCLIRFAKTHWKIIFLSIALVYGVGFLLMVLNIREGQYPPPHKPPHLGLQRRLFDPFNLVMYLLGGLFFVLGTLFLRDVSTQLCVRSVPLLTFSAMWACIVCAAICVVFPIWQKQIREYFSECLCHRIYVYLILHNILWGLAYATGMYEVFLNESLGLSLGQFGFVGGIALLASFFLAYPAGSLADRFHPLRMMVWAKALILLVAPIGLIWLFIHPAPKYVIMIQLSLLVIQIPLNMAYQAAMMPMTMRILPQESFGKFNSFAMLCASFAGILIVPLAGKFFDIMAKVFPDETWGHYYSYRFGAVWRLPFLMLSLTFVLLTYREWKRLGGKQGYVPPGNVSERTAAFLSPPTWLTRLLERNRKGAT